MPLTPGVRLGPYEVTAKISEGGMGEVFLADDTQLGRQIAIKFVGGGPADDGRALERLHREARLAAALALDRFAPVRASVHPWAVLLAIGMTAVVGLFSDPIDALGRDK